MAYVFDPQSPLAKIFCERWRDANATSDLSDGDLTFARDQKLMTRTLSTIISCRDVGRHTFLQLLSELISDRDWVRRHVHLPEGKELRISGASRTTLGETVIVKHGGDGLLQVQTAESIEHE